MPLLDTPITTDDAGLKRVLDHKIPAVLLLYNGQRDDKPLQDALKREAKKHAGNLLVVRVDVNNNPDIYARYDRPQTPAVITLTKSMLGRKEKSRAEVARPADLRVHIDHLLNDTPLPQPRQNKPKYNGNKQKGAQHVTSATFNREVLRSNVPVLVDFWAEWCAPCRAVAPFIDQLAGQYAGQIKVVKVNVDKERRAAEPYGIRSIPTFILFQNGKPAGRIAGADRRGIQRLVEQALERV